MYTLKPFYDDFFDYYLNKEESHKSNRFHVDISENDKGYLFEIDMPGASKDDLKVDFIDDRLVIKYEKEENKEEKEKNYLRRERSFSSFERSFRIKNADKDAVSAKLDNGVLTVDVPTQKNELQKTIEIK